MSNSIIVRYRSCVLLTAFHVILFSNNMMPNTGSYLTLRKFSSKRHLSNSSLSHLNMGKKTKKFVSPNKYAIISQEPDEFLSIPSCTINQNDCQTHHLNIIPNKSLFIAPPVYVNSGYEYSTLTKH